MLRMSIRNRLSYTFTLAGALLVLLLFVIIYCFIALNREDEFNKRLRTESFFIARLYMQFDGNNAGLFRALDYDISDFKNKKIGIYNSDHKLIHANDKTGSIAISETIFNNIKKNQLFFFNDNENKAAGILFKSKSKNYLVIVSAFDIDSIRVLKKLRLVLIICFLIFLNIYLLFCFRYANLLICPVNRITEEIKKITVLTLDSRLSESKQMYETDVLAIYFNQLLEQVERAMMQQKKFALNASHELITPLSVMKVQLEYASQHSLAPEEYKRITGSLLVDINNMIHLSKELLDLAQVESKTDNSSFRIYRLDEIVFLIVSEASQKYPSQKIQFNIDDVSDDDNQYYVNGIENLLKTAVLNVIDNACKYSDQRPVTINLGLTEKEIKITVKDSGLGIAPNDLQYIKDPFFRGSNALSISGHGIGFALTVQIIHLHNGRLEVDSRLEEGTTVRIYLPKYLQ